MPAKKPQGEQEFFDASPEANKEVAKSSGLFIKMAGNTHRRLRFLPANNKAGVIWFVSANHFGPKGAEFKDEEGNPIAAGCLRIHGTEETSKDCYICQVAKALKAHDATAQKKLGKQLTINPRYNAQVLEATQTDEGLEYSGPFLIVAPKQLVDGTTSLMEDQRIANDTMFNNPESGQDLIVKRKGSTMQDTKYTASLTGQKSNLDVVCPEWRKKYIRNIYTELNLTLLTPEEQKSLLLKCIGDDIDWEYLKERGL